MAGQGPRVEPASRTAPPYRLRYNSATEHLSLERSNWLTPDLQGANLDSCSIAEEGGQGGSARQRMAPPSPNSAAGQAPGVQTRKSALAAAAGRMHAPLNGKGRAAPPGAGTAVSAHDQKCMDLTGNRQTDSPTPHARSIGSEATWGPQHDYRERSRPRSFTPQPWISGTSGESSQVAEPALDRLRASPAPASNGPVAQQAGGGRGGGAWMREPARESASPMSRIQAAAPAGPAAEARASVSRQPSSGVLVPPSAVTWRTGTPSALAREPRRMNTLSIESVSASAAGSPGLRASHSPPPTQTGCPSDGAPSLPSLPPPAPAPAPRGRQRPPKAADVTAAARVAAAEAGDGRGASRGSKTRSDAAHEPLAPIGESDGGTDEGVDAAVACGAAADEQAHGREHIGISKDAAGLWQITLKVRKLSSVSVTCVVRHRFVEVSATATNRKPTG